MRSRFVGVAGWLKNSFIDFPGTVSTVLFYSGCNLRCPYCHNPGLILDSAGQDLAGSAPAPPVSEKTIFGFLAARKKTIDGVVFSGGEATLHAELVDDVKAVRALGYRVKLDTNGLLPGMIQQVTPDYLALDVKTIPSLYTVLLASPYGDVERRLRESLRLVKEMGESAEVRITIAPGVIDRSIIMHVGELVQGVKRIFLQPMQQRVRLLDPAYNGMTPVAAEEIAMYRNILSEYTEHCAVRGE
jgi:pyruvate formate lyase activating enzyme